jgi:hypothetical protein
MNRLVPLSCVPAAILTYLLTVPEMPPARPHAFAPGTSQAKPFVVSSLNNTFFAFVGELQGEFSVTDDSVLVNVSAGKILLRDSLPTYNGRRSFGGIVLRFARQDDNPAGWALEGRGTPLGFRISLAPGQQMPLPPMHFAIAKPRGRALSSLWLVFELWDMGPVEEGKTRKPGTAYIHSSHGIFAGEND